jgi:DNA-binding IclR family transcriptional regulator
LILLTLADHAVGMRIEEIARITGAKFRWIARQVSKLAQMGIVRRVGPGTYALTESAETRA